MRIGLLSDIYGNLPALEAAWTWVCGEGPEAVVCLGDLVGYGPFPSEVVRFVKSHGLETVQGNWDRAAGRGRSDPGDDFTDPTWRRYARETLAWTVSVLGPDEARFLKDLPTELRFRAGRSDILCVHGLPGNVSGRLDAENAGEVLDSVLLRNGCSVMASGNTGRPAVAVRPGGCLVNPGSVGGGTHPSAASAAVIEAGGKGAVPVWWQRIEYDFEGYEKAYRGAGLPEIFLRCFRTGRAPTGEWMTDDTGWRQRWAGP